MNVSTARLGPRASASRPTFDGAGFDPARTSYGTGLQGMADRLAAPGGSLAVSSAVGRGTTIRGEIPAGRTADVVVQPA